MTRFHEDDTDDAIVDFDDYDLVDNDNDDNDAAHPPSPNVERDPEVWMDHYSDVLLDLWYLVKDYCDKNGHAVLDACGFPDFAQFCFEFSSGHKPKV